MPCMYPSSINWAIGQLNPPWIIPLVRDNNTIFDLTGVTANQISLVIYNASKVPTGTGAGTVTIKSVKPGIITYTLASADVPTAAGTYYLRIKVNFGGTTPDFSDYITWTVAP